MISHSQIQRLASEQNVPEEIIEKDYLIELILFCLAQDSYFKEKLIFRGGTALKKIYFPDYRFSEDLDFLVRKDENLNKYEYRLDKLLLKISAEYPFQLNKRSESNAGRIQLFILYDIIPRLRAVKELKIDILKDNLIPAHQQKKILFTQQEFKQRDLTLKTYILESVVSDKIHRILGVDNEPRDIYDLQYLLKQRLDISKVKAELKKRYGYQTYLPNLLSEITKEEYRRNWQTRLEKQIVNLPAYELAIHDLKKLINTKLLS